METRDILRFRGHEVVDCRGGKVGRLEEIYVDAASKEPQWARVALELVRDRQTLVPLRGASPAGDALRIPLERQTVIEAPDASASDLYRYYGGVAGRVDLPLGPEPLGPPPDWP